MNDEQFDQELRETSQGYNRPPEVPRERMWARIQAARAERRSFWQRFAPRWWPAMAGVAAALLVGFAIHHWWPAQEQVAPSREAGIALVQPAPEIRTNIYRYAAVPHLERADALLTLVQSQEPGQLAPAPEKRWAEELLAETRLLIDSPACRDEELCVLLRDLEFVLVRIVRRTDGVPAGEKDWIRENITGRSLVTRLRHQASGARAAQGI